MVWLRFAASAVAVAAAGIAAATFGDAIAAHTRLGRFLFGTILLAASTSLPDLVTAFDALRLGLPDLAAGNMLGSCLVDTVILGLLDLFTRRTRLLHRVAVAHSLTATLATALLSLAVFFILVPLNWQWRSIDLESLVLLAAFVGGTWLIQAQARMTPAAAEAELPRLRLPWALAGFCGAAAVLVLAGPVLVASADTISRRSGLGTGFIGLALVPLVTCLPEAVSAMTAVRLDAYDLAVGNLFGSCVDNVAVLALASLCFSGRPLFNAISPGFVVVGVLAVILLDVALLGTLAQLEWRPLGIDWDAALIVILYLAGLYLVYRQGILLTSR